MPLTDSYHLRDTDCDVDPETLTCRVCGVYHGDPCPDCHQRGFHDLLCPVYLDWLMREGR